MSCIWVVWLVPIYANNISERNSAFTHKAERIKGRTNHFPGHLIFFSITGKLANHFPIFPGHVGTLSSSNNCWSFLGFMSLTMLVDSVVCTQSTEKCLTLNRKTNLKTYLSLSFYLHTLQATVIYMLLSTQSMATVSFVVLHLSITSCNLKTSGSRGLFKLIPAQKGLSQLWKQWSALSKCLCCY